MEYLSPPSTPRKNVGIKLASSGLSRTLDNVSDSKYYSKAVHYDANARENYPVEETPSKTPKSSDRFIPNRGNVDYDHCNYMLNKSFTPPREKSGTELDTSFLASVQTPSSKRLIDCFENKLSMTKVELNSTSMTAPIKKSPVLDRSIPLGPSRILDAPDLLDDYYLNLLHWGHNNIIAVALNQSVYLWHAATGHIDQLLKLDEPGCHVTSLQWSAKDNNIAIGTSDNTVQLWDPAASSCVRVMEGHSDRVSSLSWNNDVISSGGRDSVILNHDVRQRRHVQSKFIGHEQEICGLAWSPDGSVLASGGNENMLCLWDAAMSGRRSSAHAVNEYTPKFVLTQHQAAVKALSWCPWQKNTLASGGGTADRKIRIWNSSTGTVTKSVDTGSQVCAIQWSDTYRELVSSHGFSDNQLILWKYSNMSKIREFRGHTARVLHLAKSPTGNTICSASADETIRFWDIFGGSASTPSEASKAMSVATPPKRKASMLSGNLAMAMR